MAAVAAPAPARKSRRPIDGCLGSPLGVLRTWPSLLRLPRPAAPCGRTSGRHAEARRPPQRTQSNSVRECTLHADLQRQTGRTSPTQAARGVPPSYALLAAIWGRAKERGCQMRSGPDAVRSGPPGARPPAQRRHPGGEAGNGGFGRPDQGDAGLLAATPSADLRAAAPTPPGGARAASPVQGPAPPAVQDRLSAARRSLDHGVPASGGVLAGGRRCQVACS